jgi:hypothetical protein
MRKDVPVKYVIVETRRQRPVARRGLSFETKEAAQAYIDATYKERIRSWFRVEARAIRVDDDGERMTCQCCGRKILAKHGSIAHHGYERPDYGYQTASCMGAKELPFEVDRKALGRQIVSVNYMRERMQAARDQIADETLPVRLTWKERVFGVRNREIKSFDFTRENFDADEGRKALRDAGRSDYGGFDRLLKIELANRDSALRSIATDIKMYQERYDGWKQTHEWKERQWVALAMEAGKAS